MAKLPRAVGADLFVVERGVWNELCARVEKCEGLTVAQNGGMELSDQPGGKVLSVKTIGANSLITVRLGSDRTGDAWYGGNVWDIPAPTADTTANATAAAAGTEGEEVSILNLQECEGASETGHDLTHALNDDQRLFLGRVTGQRDENGLPVVHINGTWSYICT